MDTSLARAMTRLDKGSLLRIDDARGRGIAVFSGSVWITQDGDQRDHFVEQGRTMQFDLPGLVIVQALEPTGLLVFGTAPAANAASFDDAIEGMAETRRAFDARVLHVQARRLRAQALGAAVEQAGTALKHGTARALDAIGSAAAAAARRLAA